MPSASVQAMSRSIAPHHVSPPTHHRPTTSFNYRDHDLDDDTLNAILQKNVDPTAFIRAQHEALQAMDDAALAKALKASQETAAQEEAARRKREEQSATATVARESRPSVSSIAGPSSAPKTSSSSSADSGKRHSTDEAAARHLAKTWRVDALQPALLDSTSANTAPAPPLASSSSNSTVRSRASKPSVPSAPPNVSTSTTYDAPRPSLRSYATDIPSSSSRHREATTTTHPSRSSSTRTNVAIAVPDQLSRESSSSSSKISASPTASSPVRIPMKRAAASARDLRVGLSMSQDGKRNSESVTRSKLRPSGLTPEHESASSRDLFTATRQCTQCNELIVSPRTHVVPSESRPTQISDLLHVKCLSCAVIHCRGCFAVLQCPRQCDGSGDSCALKKCCSEVRAIAIFEALSSFDTAYAAEGRLAGRGDKNDRYNYLQLVLSNADKPTTQKFEKLLIPTLRTICSWLQKDGDDDDDSDPKLHSTVQRLFSMSFLPEVVAVFLSNKSVRNWVALSGSYIEILEVLRHMADIPGLSKLLSEPLQNIDQSCGLQRWIWDQGPITWEAANNDSNEPVRSPPLCDLVKQLQSQRRPLMDLAARVKFSQTVEKANTLCDGISYLLLQQVLGGD